MTPPSTLIKIYFMKSLRKLFLIPIIILSLSVFLNGCEPQTSETSVSSSSSISDLSVKKETEIIPSEQKDQTSTTPKEEVPDDGSFIPASSEENEPSQDTTPIVATTFDLSSVPTYNGLPSVIINNNVPFFTENDITTEAFEKYSPLDSKRRCGVAFANICKELMPTEERGPIGHVRPSGWHTANYHELIDGNYLYNRCHLIAFSLAGENDNENNLITGTRYMNINGMTPYEDKVRDYVKRTGHHVLYRVTPIFEGDNLVATGVLMEAKSVEDIAISFCVFCYNVQPNITIDYLTGDSFANVDSSPTLPTASETSDESQQISPSQAETMTYILNTNTKKFHYPSCRSVSQMAEHNKKEFTGTRDEILASGYSSCGNCHP